MNKNQDKGFTLIELLIVIVILGILAAVTVFAVGGITKKGQENACDVEQRTVETAIQAYYAENGLTYPTVYADLDTYLEDTAAISSRIDVTFPAAADAATVEPTIARAGTCANTTA